MFFWQKWWPPKYGYKMAHSNILEIIAPYVYKEKVIELLGQPHEADGNHAAYRFSNALLQVNYDGDFVESVALVSLKMGWPNRFRVFPLSFVLGRSTFEDACTPEENQEHIELVSEGSTKFFSLVNEQYFGNPGRYFYYSFALLDADTYPPVSMPKTQYRAKEEDQMQNGATLLNSKTKFNAIGISLKKDDGLCFYFQMFN
ncbi:hypothetical protein [Janthinobacterium lividum]|uniref:hypothetical protein n=1 Tax=Janthinobacterium lividum TaxID=29581 RepID=UPI0015961D7C|nr:hypothetical protein [Janthinobacterium lividum]QKY07708.1 hypothetical protein G8765_07925 [Janthinobacterium lividum]